MGHERRWPLWQRFSVLYLFVYWLLYALPAPLRNLWATIFHAWRESGHLPGWAHSAHREVDGWFEKPGEWWFALLQWLQDRGLTFGATMYDTATSYGDTRAAWMRVLCIAVAALVIAGNWAWFTRRLRPPAVICRWLHLGARWWLALILLEYGLAKWWGGQFPPPTIVRMTTELGDLMPDAVLWMFMAKSEAYVWFSSIGELLGFALLLHRRTALAGCFVSMGVMANVCALNWCYGVPLKQYTTHLLLTSVLLMLPFRRRLWAVFVSNSRTSEPVDLRVVKRPWLGWPLLLVGVLLAGSVATVGVLQKWRSHQHRAKSTRAMPVLFGLWQVQSMQLDGKPVDRYAAERWRDIAIDRGNAVRIRRRTGMPLWFSCSENDDATVLTVTKSGYAGRGANGPGVEWQTTRSTVMRKGFHPAPRGPEDYRNMIDVERDALTITGQWQGKPFEVFAVRKVFLYDKPFWWMKENPR